MAPRDRIAIVKGVFAKPGVSKNRRWYKPEHIAAAVTEAQALIDSGNAPTVYSMLTHHGARDALNGDVTRTAGQVTKVGLNAQGWGTFEADIADTTAGNDIAALTTPKNPFLKGVSMASVWKGIPRKVMGPDNQPCETADGFSLKGIDYTHNPGITGAEISSAELVESSAGDLIYESIEEDVFVEKIDESADEVTQVFADPGYRGAKAFEITTPAQIRGAWVESHKKSVTESYTPKQVQRIRGKVKSAAQKAGFDIVAETNLFGAEILEAYTSVCIDNGPADLRVSAYIDDPSKLAVVTQKVSMAAMAALHELDPDNDGDIDLPGGEADNDDEMGPDCPSCNAVVPIGALYCPACGQPVPQGESAPDNKEAEMAEATTTGAANESTPLTLTQTQLDEAIAAGAKAALEAAGIKPTEVIEESDDLKAARKLVEEADASKTATETTTTAGAANESAASGTFTPEQVKTMVTEAAADAAKTATEAALDLARKEIQESGPRRRGFVSKAILEQGPDEVYGEKPLSGMTLQDLERATDSAMVPLIDR